MDINRLLPPEFDPTQEIEMDYQDWERMDLELQAIAYNKGVYNQALSPNWSWMTALIDVVEKHLPLLGEDLTKVFPMHYLNTPAAMFQIAYHQEIVKMLDGELTRMFIMLEQRNLILPKHTAHYFTVLYKQWYLTTRQRFIKHKILIMKNMKENFRVIVADQKGRNWFVDYGMVCHICQCHIQFEANLIGIHKMYPLSPQGIRTLKDSVVSVLRGKDKACLN